MFHSSKHIRTEEEVPSRDFDAFAKSRPCSTHEPSFYCPGLKPYLLNSKEVLFPLYQNFITDCGLVPRSHIFRKMLNSSLRAQTQMSDDVNSVAWPTRGATKRFGTAAHYSTHLSLVSTFHLLMSPCLRHCRSSRLSTAGWWTSLHPHPPSTYSTIVLPWHH